MMLLDGSGASITGGERAAFFLVEVIVGDASCSVLAECSGGRVWEAPLIADGGGSGYFGGDTISVSGGDSNATFTVSTVAGGIVVSGSITTAGSNYIQGTNYEWFISYLTDIHQFVSILGFDLDKLWDLSTYFYNLDQ